MARGAAPGAPGAGAGAGGGGRGGSPGGWGPAGSPGSPESAAGAGCPPLRASPAAAGGGGARGACPREPEWEFCAPQFRRLGGGSPRARGGTGAGAGAGGPADAGTPGPAGGGAGSPSEGDAWFDRLQAGQVATDLRSPTPVRDALQRSWLARLARECATSSAWALAAALAQPGLHPKVALARALRVSLEDELPALGLGPGCGPALDRMLPPLGAAEGARLRRALRRSLRHLGGCSPAAGQQRAAAGAAADAGGARGPLPCSPRGILQRLHGVSRDCLDSRHWVFLATEVQPDLDARMALATALRAELDEEIPADHAAEYTQVAAVLRNLPPLEPAEAARLRDALRLRAKHIGLHDSEMDGGLSGRCLLLRRELEVMRRWMIWEQPLRGNAADWSQLTTCAALRAMNGATSVDPSGSKAKLLTELARHTYHTVPPYYRRALLEDPGDASAPENPSCDLLHRREAVLGLPPLCAGCVGNRCRFCAGWDTRRRQWTNLQGGDPGEGCRPVDTARPLRRTALVTASPRPGADTSARKRSHGECQAMVSLETCTRKRVPLKTLSFNS